MEEGSPQKGTTKDKYLLRRSPRNLTTSYIDSPSRPHVNSPPYSNHSTQYPIPDCEVLEVLNIPPLTVSQPPSRSKPNPLNSHSIPRQKLPVKRKKTQTPPPTFKPPPPPPPEPKTILRVKHAARRGATPLKRKSTPPSRIPTPSTTIPTPLSSPPTPTPPSPAVDLQPPCIEPTPPCIDPTPPYTTPTPTSPPTSNPAQHIDSIMILK